VSAVDLVDFTMQDAFIAMVAKGLDPISACAKLGISKRTMDALIRSDADLKARYDEAYEVATARLHNRAYELAMDGDAKFMEIAFRRRAPEMAQAAPGSKPVPVGQATQSAKLVVLAVGEILMGEQAPALLDRLHHPEAIEVTARDDDNRSDS